MSNNSLTGTNDLHPSPIYRLGGQLVICRMGFGAMRLTGQPGNWGPYADWAHGVRVIREAVEIGVNFIDTADAYGPGESEKLIADALHPYADTIIIATKGGTVKTGPGAFHADGSPEYLKKACNLSLARLRRDCIDLYQLHRVDPQVPITASVEALADLRAEGKIRLIGLSNVTLAQVQEAQKIVPIASVQNRYNLRARGDDPLIDYCEQHNIAYLPYSPLGAPPFDPAAPLTDSSDAALASVAARRQMSPGQVALSWLLHRAPNVVPIPGTTSLEHLRQNFRALTLRLSTEELAELAAG